VFFRYDSSGPPATAIPFPAFVCGDDLTVRETIDGLAGADTPTAATLSIKNLPTDSDAAALVRKTITTVSAAAGQLTLVGGRWLARFELTAAETALVSATVSQVYDIQVTLSSGRIGTPRFGSIQGVAQITVGAGAAVFSVTLTGAGAMNLYAGQATAVVVGDALGGVLAGRVVTYASSDTAVLRVTADGYVIAVGAGTASITATCEGVISAPLTITVSRAVILEPEASWVPGRDGYHARGNIGQRAIHFGGRSSFAQAGSGVSGVVMQSGGSYTAGTDEWDEFGGTTEATAPVNDGVPAGWEGTVQTTEVDATLGVTSHFGPGYFMGTVARRWTHDAWDGVTMNARPHLYARQLTTALEAANQPAGDDLLFYWIIPYKTEAAANVGKKLLVRATAITSGGAWDIRIANKDLIPNRIANCFEQEITLQGYWQTVVATVRCTAAEWAAVRITGDMRVEIMQVIAAGDRGTSVVLGDGWNNSFTGIPGNKTGYKFAFQAQPYRLGTTDPGATSQLIPRHDTRLFWAAGNPAIVQTIESDNIASASWTKAGGVVATPSARAAPNARHVPSQVLASVLWPAGGTISQDADHRMEEPGPGGNVLARSMSYRSVYARFYARTAAGGANPDLTGITATITTLVAGVPTTVYGPTQVSAVDEFGISTTRFGFPAGEAATRYRLTLTNVGATRTILMLRLVGESGAGNNQGGEHMVPTVIPARTTTGWRGQNGVHLQFREADDILSPRTGAWAIRVYMRENFADPAFNTNTNGNSAFVLDTGPIANSKRKIGLSFDWSAAAGYQRLHPELEGDTPRGRNQNMTTDLDIYADGVSGSGVKYGTLAQAGARGLKDFAMVWDNWANTLVRIGAVTYATGIDPATADVNYTAQREWGFGIPGDADNDGVYPLGDRDRRMSICALGMGMGFWKRQAPNAADLSAFFDSLPTAA
jgi:hypothetical protein